jgi:hypothetical protein
MRLENDLLAVTVLPEKGADIHSLVWKPQALDILWKAPWGLSATGAAALAAGTEAAWMDQYAGGWQVIFPNGGDACTYRGAPLNFHGEASLSAWNCAARRDGKGLDLSLKLRRSPFALSRALTLEENSPALLIADTIENLGEEPLHYMWGQHPAFGRPFLDGCRLQVPAKRFLAHDVEISPSCRIAAGAAGPWPVLTGKNGAPVDLRVVPLADERVTEFGYLTDLDDGWYALVNRERNLAFGLAWPREIFPYLWFWQELRGSFGYPWYGRCSVMAIEPFTSIPGAGLERAIARGTAPVLPPGGKVEARFAAVFFEAGEVESIGLDGTVRMRRADGDHA